jgi:hypothetical protein
MSKEKKIVNNFVSSNFFAELINETRFYFSFRLFFSLYCLSCLQNAAKNFIMHNKQAERNFYEN